MPSFFHDTTPAAAADHNTSKRSFNLFGKKKKAEPTPQQAPPPPPAKEPTPPPTPKPPVEEQRKASPRPRKLVKKGSTDIDDELRQHFKREGYAFLAFSDPAKTAAHSSSQTPEKQSAAVADPAESSRRDGTLLKDAIGLIETKSVEAPRPTSEKKADSTPPVSSKKPGPEVDYSSPAPRQPMQPIQPTQQAKPGFFTKMKPSAAPGKTENVPVSSQLPLRTSSMAPASNVRVSLYLEKIVLRRNSSRLRRSSRIPQLPVPVRMSWTGRFRGRRRKRARCRKRACPIVERIWERKSRSRGNLHPFRGRQPTHLLYSRQRALRQWHDSPWNRRCLTWILVCLRPLVTTTGGCRDVVLHQT
jgi:hypothetical protein